MRAHALTPTRDGEGSRSHLPGSPRPETETYYAAYTHAIGEHMPTAFYAHLREKGTDWLLCWPVPVGDGVSRPVAVRRRDLHHIPDWNIAGERLVVIDIEHGLGGAQLAADWFKRPIMFAGTRQEKRVWSDGVERTATVIETLPFRAEEL